MAAAHSSWAETVRALDDLFDASEAQDEKVAVPDLVEVDDEATEGVALVSEDGASLGTPDEHIPWRLVVPLLLLQLSEAFCGSSLFSYLPFFVQEALDVPASQVGLYAGFLASSYYVGQLLSSFVWGVASDRFGKRPCIMLGSCATLVASLLMGFANTFWMALLARGINGSLNGSVGITKAYMGQISSKKTQTRLFGLIGYTWSCGNIIGGVYGGFLSQPSDKWPGVFSGTIFARWRYLLPNLVTTAFILLGLVAAYFFLEEPKRNAGPRPSLTAVFGFRLAWVTCSLYAMLGFVMTSTIELVPLWIILAPPRGLGFSSSQLGAFNSLLGIESVAVLMVVYPLVAPRLGLVASYRLGLSCLVPSILAVPLLRWFQLPVLWVLIAFLLAVRAVGAQFSFSVIPALMCNSVPPSLMGSVNGLGQSMVAATRMIAPVVVGPLFAWSVALDRPFPLDLHFVFLALAVVAMCTLLWSIVSLPVTLNHPPDEDATAVELTSVDEKPQLE